MFTIVILSIFTLVILLMIRNNLGLSNMEQLKKVLLLGASVGKHWNFSEWPERMNMDGYYFEMLPVYTFDKTQGLEEILMRPKRKFRPSRTYLKSLLKPAPRKPDVIIIKECAAYFPGDIENYKKLMRSWVNKSIEYDIKPVLATVVPITEAHSHTKKDRLKRLLEFNDWLRQYANDKNLYCLDLEKALRTNEQQRYLRSDLAVQDGMHLNPKAYQILDNLVLENLKYIIE